MQVKLENDKNICAVILEPVQGEAGIKVPSKDYLTKVSKLCKKHNVLFIADEVQTGFGRTGKLMAYEWDDCKPDILCLGKSLSGGVIPVSAALCNDNIMLTIKPGEHGSTFGGYHLGMAVANTAVKCLIEEGMVENSQVMGKILEESLGKIKSPLIAE